MPPKQTTKKRSHKNDLRRTTAPERAKAWLASPPGKATLKTLTKAFEDHATATLARHRAKQRKARK